MNSGESLAPDTALRAAPPAGTLASLSKDGTAVGSTYSAP